MPEPVCVLIADIHYDINTLELADRATRMAIDKANELSIPLVVAGDLHNTKANMRGECVNAMIETFQLCDIRPGVLVGNHDKINEKSEDNSLNFLRPYADVIQAPVHASGIDSYLIPYYHDPEELRVYLKTLPKKSRLIMHQGIEGSNAGDYIQDKSAINHEDVKDFRVISGHYHQRQDIKTGRPQKGAIGLWSYIGNSYTTNYAEASDPPKGFQILMEDGTLEFVPTNLRKHIVLELKALGPLRWDWSSPEIEQAIRKDDLIWVKVKGTKEILNDLYKPHIDAYFGLGNAPYRLDLIPTDSPNATVDTQNKSQYEILDSIIGSLSDTSEERKERLKELWKGMI